MRLSQVPPSCSQWLYSREKRFMLNTLRDPHMMRQIAHSDAFHVSGRKIFCSTTSLAIPAQPLHITVADSAG